MRLFTKKPPRIWGWDEDGSPHIQGITVGDLIKKLHEFSPTDEVCMTVAPKKYENGGGLMGKLKHVAHGIEGQIWLHGGVIDESLE